MNIMDKLYSRISELKNPTVAGLDTRIEYLPESFVNEIMPEASSPLRMLPRPSISTTCAWWMRCMISCRP
jgi:hypothetical protein